MDVRHNKQEAPVENKHLLPYGSRTLDPAIRLVDRAREIEEAHVQIQAHVGGKLEVIARQIRALQEEARGIVEQAAFDAELHKIPCNFEKRIGMILHLYRRENGTQYFSMLSLEDWEGHPPHPFEGSFKLREDRSFQRVDQAGTAV